MTTINPQSRFNSREEVIRLLNAFDTALCTREAYSPTSSEFHQALDDIAAIHDELVERAVLCVSEAEGTELHSNIMSIRTLKARDDFQTDAEWMAYRTGHRDARHAGAEIASVFVAGLKKALNESLEPEKTSPVMKG